MPLSSIVEVSVQVSPVTPSPQALNVGLIVGPSTVIPVATRTVTYNSTAEMAAAGWTGSEPEYAAAQLYFGQTTPATSLVVGVQNVAAAESIATAVTACRASNADWYGVYACGAADADVEAVAAFVQTASPVSTFFYDTQDTSISGGTTPNLMSTLQSSGYSRTWGIYSTTAHAGAAALGLASGLDTGLANSAFTLAYKSLVGVNPEPLTGTQVQAILGWNGNVYTSYGGEYDLLVQGQTANGTPFDQVLALDTIATDAAAAVMNALTTLPQVPLTDAGVTILVNDLTAVLAQAATQGLLAPGPWNAAPVLTLQTGQNLPNGYVVVAAPVSSLTAAQISARQAPAIYLCVKLAGAIEHAVIGLTVGL
jgi:hypothetical protein